LYLLDTVKETTEEVVVYAPTDDHFDLVEFINPKDHIEAFDISPSGKRVVFDARGDIFTAPAERGDIRNLTSSPGTREQHPVWSPDGRYIAYVSDATGEQEVHIIDQRGEDEPVQLTDNGNFKFGLKWSPDSRKLLYHTTSDHRLYLVNVEKKQVVEVVYNEIYNDHLKFPAYSWSPDSKWVAYLARERNRNADIYLYSVEESRSYQFTKGPTDDYNPVFAPDGKTLVYMS
jgi:tricorn protease